MDLYVEDLISGNFTISQAIYEAALIITVLRWILCFLFKLIRNRRTDSDQEEQDQPSNPSPLHPSCSWQMLPLTSFGEIMERLQTTDDNNENDTCCAVCLNQLKMEDEVRELMNCYHVFHRECIEKWLEHEHENENYNPTCPLCRAPLLLPSSSSSSSSSYYYYYDSISSESSSTCLPPPQPSWAVERLLYLFGDDLLPC